jgi:hypothetical protein
MHLRLEGERDVCRWINGGANRESNLSRAAPAAVLRLPLLRGSFPRGVGSDTTGSIRMPSHFLGRRDFARNNTRATTAWVAATRSL